MDYLRIGVGVFVWRDGKFLIGKRKGAHGENTWSVPGGHLEFEESWETCAAREVMEETGMQIANARFLAATNDIFGDENKHYVTVWIECDWQANEPRITEPDKFIDQKWCDFTSLPRPLFEPCWQNLYKQKPELFARH